MSELRLFEAFGIELEYMIVSADTLAVLPAADKVLIGDGGEVESEIEVGDLAWSNELVAHVIELKTNGPAPELEALPAAFARGVGEVNERLRAHGGRLLPTAMHPLMDPLVETVLWPHEHDAVYRAFDRIFGCRGHGWANLQSMHVNLPFSGDDELGRLHSAIRFLLPLMPALSASSPFREGVATGLLDTRLSVYRTNCQRIPSITSGVVPEPVFTRREYETQILEKIYRDIAPHDPEGTLQYEWLNARGAIARFDRSAIEIRVLDIQEHPSADLAIAALITGALRAMVDDRLPGSDPMALRGWPSDLLKELLEGVIAEGDRAPVPPEYARSLGCKAESTAGDVWRGLAEKIGLSAVWDPALSVILGRGPLARRILEATGPTPTRETISEVYRELASCLAEGRLFTP